MKGRKPMPERLKLLQEETQRVIGSTEAPKKPSWLSGDAAEEWDRIVAELSKLYVVSPLDAMTLAAYCKAYALWRKFDAVLDEEGPTTVTASGEVKAHPAAKVCMSMFAEIRRMAAEFGMSPAARSRIDAPKPENPEDAEFEAYAS